MTTFLDCQSTSYVTETILNIGPGYTLKRVASMIRTNDNISVLFWTHQRRVQDTVRQPAFVQCLVHTKSPRLYLDILDVQIVHLKWPGMVAVTCCEPGFGRALAGALYLELASCTTMKPIE